MKKNSIWKIGYLEEIKEAEACVKPDTKMVGQEPNNTKKYDFISLYV